MSHPSNSHNRRESPSRDPGTWHPSPPQPAPPRRRLGVITRGDPATRPRLSKRLDRPHNIPPLSLHRDRVVGWAAVLIIIIRTRSIRCRDFFVGTWHFEDEELRSASSRLRICWNEDPALGSGVTWVGGGGSGAGCEDVVRFVPGDFSYMHNSA